MLGCKYEIIDCTHDKGIELIDTCWDVNSDMLVGAWFDYWELIDTCWDVND